MNIWLILIGYSIGLVLLGMGIGIALMLAWAMMRARSMEASD